MGGVKLMGAKIVFKGIVHALLLFSMTSSATVIVKASLYSTHV